ncbi:MAG: DUF1501 domain-containing protein [Acidobacteriia bacterium]|nr:DUF1501 domain-containing protein [Terriglobia bacterium]MYG02780.1 DUF1501 domain-containing protein [Terriglobia bacterium]MYK12112.1 DUF1501 domain-containing protein [Terriglobia bacterium]
MTSETYRAVLTRRSFLDTCAAGIGTLGLAQLMGLEGILAATASGGAAPQPHFAPKAKNLIFLFMAGAPSQMDLFDPKPGLQKWHGQPLPPSMTADLKLAFIKPTAKVLASPRSFSQCGQSRTEISDYLPNLQRVADDICLVRSMQTDQVNHHPGQSMLMSGSPLVGRPTIGSWLSYGLGSESQNLPGFVVLSSGRGASGGSSNFSSGFLPSIHGGVPFRKTGDPILFLSNPAGVSRESQRLTLETLGKLNSEHLQRAGDPQIASRMANYELAFRMQASAPELIDFADESQATKDSYGVDEEPTSAYGTNCLMARRMVERGVRVVMLIHASWDDHTNLDEGLKKNCDITDKPVAALVEDLKQRGLLDETLVVWGGEFGRTSLGQLKHVGDKVGRDHHPNGYSMWLAGGGIQGGQVVGSTDELALKVEEDPVHVHDLQATILHLMGLDHERLTYRHMGRDFRLTDVSGNVVDRMLA